MLWSPLAPLTASSSALRRIRPDSAIHRGTRGRPLKPAAAHGVDGCLESRLGAERGHQATQPALDRSLSDAECPRYRPVLQALPEQVKELRLLMGWRPGDIARRRDGASRQPAARGWRLEVPRLVVSGPPGDGGDRLRRPANATWPAGRRDVARLASGQRLGRRRSRWGLPDVTGHVRSFPSAAVVLHVGDLPAR